MSQLQLYRYLARRFEQAANFWRDVCHELANSGDNQGLEVPFVQARMERRWQNSGLGFHCRSSAELRIANQSGVSRAFNGEGYGVAAAKTESSNTTLEVL